MGRAVRDSDGRVRVQSLVPGRRPPPGGATVDSEQLSQLDRTASAVTAPPIGGLRRRSHTGDSDSTVARPWRLDSDGAPGDFKLGLRCQSDSRLRSDSDPLPWARPDNVTRQSLRTVLDDDIDHRTRIMMIMTWM